MSGERHANASGWLRNETRRLSLMRRFQLIPELPQETSAVPNPGLRPKTIIGTRANQILLTSRMFRDAKCLIADRKPAAIAIAEKTINAASSSVAFAAERINWSFLRRVACLPFCKVCDTLSNHQGDGYPGHRKQRQADRHDRECEERKSCALSEH
jgi:hypothetical protein